MQHIYIPRIKGGSAGFSPRLRYINCFTVGRASSPDQSPCSTMLLDVTRCMSTQKSYTRIRRAWIPYPTEQILYCKHSIRHSSSLSSWWGNCGKEARDSFPQFPHQLLAFATYVSQQVQPHVSDRGLNHIGMVGE